MTSRKNVFDIISHERDHQNTTATRLIGKESFPLFEWLNFIDAHLLQARRAESVLEATEEIRNLAACAVAALEEYGARIRTPELNSQATLNELMNPQSLPTISYTPPTATPTRWSKAQSRDKKGSADRRTEKKHLKNDDDDDDDLYGIGSLNLNDDDDDDEDAESSS